MAENILVVDDEKSWQELIEFILMDEDRAIFLVGSKDEALEFLRRQAFGVVIADLRLNERDETNVDGLLLLESIQANYADEPMQSILLTGYGTPSIVRDAFQKYHVSDFVEKAQLGTQDSVFEEQLRSAVNNAIAARFKDNAGRIFGTLRSRIYNENLLKKLSEQLHGAEGLQEVTLNRLEGFLTADVPPVLYLPLYGQVSGPTRVRTNPPTSKFIGWSRSTSKAIMIFVQPGESEISRSNLFTEEDKNWEPDIKYAIQGSYYSSLVCDLNRMSFSDFEDIINA